jgi:hypothetical protein
MEWCNPMVAIEHVNTNNHGPPTHLAFCLLHCYVTKATSSHSLMCIDDRESRSLEPLSSAILHRERVNKVFGKRSSWLPNLLHQVVHYDSSTSLSIAHKVSSHLPWISLVCVWSKGIYCCWRSQVCTQFLNHVLHIEYIDLCRHDLTR